MGVIDEVLGAVGGGSQGYTAGRNQQIALARQQMLDKLMMESQGWENKLRQAQATHMQNEDNPTLAGQLAGVRAGAEANATTPAKKDLAQYTSNLEEGREGRLARVRAAVTPKYTPFASTDENGMPTAVPFDTKTGQFGPPAAGVHPLGKGGMGSLPPNVIAGMAEQARQAHQIMNQFEQKYLTGKSSVGAASGVMGSMASTHPNGIMSSAEKVLGNIGLSATNPEYQQYLAAKQRFGNIMGNLMSKRYSEYQGALDTDLSGINGGDVEPTIRVKQSYREDLLKHIPGGMGGPGAVTPGGATPQSGGRTIVVNGKTFQVPE